MTDPNDVNIGIFYMSLDEEYYYESTTINTMIASLSEVKWHSVDQEQLKVLQKYVQLLNQGMKRSGGMYVIVYQHNIEHFLVDPDIKDITYEKALIMVQQEEEKKKKEKQLREERAAKAARTKAENAMKKQMKQLTELLKKQGHSDEYIQQVLSDTFVNDKKRTTK